MGVSVGIVWPGGLADIRVETWRNPAATTARGLNLHQTLPTPSPTSWGTALGGLPPLLPVPALLVRVNLTRLKPWSTQTSRGDGSELVF